MGWTILNLIGFAIGAYFTKTVWSFFRSGEIFAVCNIIVTIFICLNTGFPLGIVFSLLSIITGVLAGMLLTGKDGISGDDLQRAFNAQQATKARANPTLAMLDSINLSMKNNSPSVPFFGGQQCDQYGTQSRIKTELDIRSGREENGTNGVWLKD